MSFSIGANSLIEGVIKGAISVATCLGFLKMLPVRAGASAFVPLGIVLLYAFWLRQVEARGASKTLQ